MLASMQVLEVEMLARMLVGMQLSAGFYLLFCDDITTQTLLSEIYDEFPRIYQDLVQLDESTIRDFLVLTIEFLVVTIIYAVSTRPPVP